MEENSLSYRKKCTKCEKIISLYESDYNPEDAEWKHIDGSKGHEINASNYSTNKIKPFWKIW